MIPIRDHNKPHTFPFVNYLLITINVLVFGYMITLPENLLEQFVLAYALIPAEIVSGANLHTLFTSMFLHGGFAHIIGNMLFMNVFGDNLEDALGHFKYLIFYLISGLGASALQIIIDPGGTIPNLGASGAIAGLMGGYLILFPKHKVDILLPVFGFFSSSTVPAYTMLIYWFIFQTFSGIGSLGIVDQGGVAYFAHIGGFLAGVVLILPFRGLIMRKFKRWWQ